MSEVGSVGDSIGSLAVKSDAWHHRSYAITSAFAFVGISIALLGGPGRGGSVVNQDTRGAEASVYS
jgi:divalent metal cation (Fe/Co/Zn/Cd) transporter